MDMADDVQYVADLRHVRLLGFSQTANLLAINACVFIEQFGYGFGFTAYMLYLMYYADGPQKTAHYAICTGFMALGMMIPGMFAGWLQEQLGYNHFSYGSCCAASCRSLRCRC